MALVNCSECGKQISDKAAACPNCGAPVADAAQPAAAPVEASQATLFRNPRTGESANITNASTYTLFFGSFYLALKGIWGHAIISLVLAILTFGISWLIYPFFAQGIIRRHLLQAEWVPVAAKKPTKIDRRADKWIVVFVMVMIAFLVIAAVTTNPPP